MKAGLTPPYFKEIVKNFDINPGAAKDILLFLVKENHIIKATEELYFHTEAIAKLKDRLVDFLMSEDEMTTPQFKEMTGVSRKYLIPLIEYFDSINVTIRIGDIRKLRQ